MGKMQGIKKAKESKNGEHGGDGATTKIPKAGINVLHMWRAVANKAKRRVRWLIYLNPPSTLDNLRLRFVGGGVGWAVVGADRSGVPKQGLG
jgi:hypothetical protein